MDPITKRCVWDGTTYAYLRTCIGGKKNHGQHLQKWCSYRWIWGLESSSLSLVPFPCPSVKLHGVIWIELALYKLNCSVDPELKRWGTHAYRCGSWLQLNIIAHAMLICMRSLRGRLRLNLLWSMCFCNECWVSTSRCCSLRARSSSSVPQPLRPWQM